MIMLPFFFILFIITNYFVHCNYSNDKEIIAFLCLGDWGKGGTSAVHSSSISTSNYLRSDLSKKESVNSEELYQRDIAIAVRILFFLEL